jgi:hypothetical protein
VAKEMQMLDSKGPGHAGDTQDDPDDQYQPDSCGGPEDPNYDDDIPF